VQPRLIDVTVPRQPAAVALVLHGGASRRGNMMVSPAQLSVLRMVPIANRLGHLDASRLAVYRLLNSARGWDTHHTPVQDARWALDRIAARHGKPLPTSLVGHSLGGRAALLTAGRTEVVSTVALAPWVDPTDVASGLDGKQILIVHGSQDRIASPERSAELARRLSRHAEVSYVTVQGGKHAMLRRHAAFTGLATEFVGATLLGAADAGTLALVRAGKNWITV
jgi:pimeloyl-ACP methyl ester carboxylesterase